MNKQLISIIIPTVNEEGQLEKLIPYLKEDASFTLVKEIIVVDAGSTDRTVAVGARYGSKVMVSPIKSRAVQMNLGASKASGRIFYFLHADTYPPKEFATKIVKAINQGAVFGCFRLRFDWRHWFLSLNSWFTRFSFKMFRFGDQSLFVTSQTFANIEGFNEHLRLFEDQEIISRLQNQGLFRLVPESVITSARKYRKNGPFRLQLVYYLLYLMYSLGFSQQALMRTYLRLVPDPGVNQGYNEHLSK